MKRPTKLQTGLPLTGTTRVIQLNKLPLTLRNRTYRSHRHPNLPRTGAPTVLGGKLGGEDGVEDAFGGVEPRDPHVVHNTVSYRVQADEDGAEEGGEERVQLDVGEYGGDPVDRERQLADDEDHGHDKDGYGSALFEGVREFEAPRFPDLVSLRTAHGGL